MADTHAADLRHNLKELEGKLECITQELAACKEQELKALNFKAVLERQIKVTRGLLESLCFPDGNNILDAPTSASQILHSDKAPKRTLRCTPNCGHCIDCPRCGKHLSSRSIKKHDKCCSLELATPNSAASTATTPPSNNIIPTKERFSESQRTPQCTPKCTKCVDCTKCGQHVSGGNLKRHQKTCLGKCLSCKNNGFVCDDRGGGAPSLRCKNCRSAWQLECVFLDPEDGAWKKKNEFAGLKQTVKGNAKD